MDGPLDEDLGFVGALSLFLCFPLAEPVVPLGSTAFALLVLLGFSLRPNVLETDCATAARSPCCKCSDKA